MEAVLAAGLVSVSLRTASGTQNLSVKRALGVGASPTRC